ncbi:MAG: hypothetical protein IPI30_12065 [Saprospiraceae bacterium]|nr:hypothetical protein [Candidatus Vicinibacter affinis]
MAEAMERHTREQKNLVVILPLEFPAFYHQGLAFTAPTNNKCYVTRSQAVYRIQKKRMIIAPAYFYHPSGR